MTKKVLILSVIAMLALGVFALATGPTVAQQKVQGATCAESSLAVTSTIGVEQGYVATATSYDASFCGAPCSCICANGPSIINRALSGHYVSVPFNANAILISQLSVESNMQSISVSVTVTQPSLSNATYYLIYTSGGSLLTSSYFYSQSPQSVSMDLSSLSGNSSNSTSPYAGTIDVVIDGLHTEWGMSVPVGDYVIATTFTISPRNTF